MNDRPLRLLVVSGFPSTTRPSYQTFVHAFLEALAQRGVQITVIAPEKVNEAIRLSGQLFRLAPRHEEDRGILVRRPRYVSFSNRRIPLLGNTVGLTLSSFTRAVLQELSRLHGQFDLCFSHFLFPNGFAGAQVSQRLGIPAVLSLGESRMARWEKILPPREIDLLLRGFRLLIANSPTIRDYCLTVQRVPEEKILVVPNGVDSGLFFPREKDSARRACGLPSDRLVAISVGHFSERKGQRRVLEALKSGPHIGLVFLGRGLLDLSRHKQVLFCGEVRHEEVPLWLSAADLFVLPTTDEGCSNAILEALSCGLPVVSSDRPFNHGILDRECSILVNPLDISALRKAISRLADDRLLRAAMSRAARRKARAFTLAARADTILGLLKSAAGQGSLSSAGKESLATP